MPAASQSVYEAVKRIDWRDHLACGCDAGLRLQRRQRIHQAHDLRLPAAQGRGLRQPARRHGRAAEHPTGASRRAAASARRGPYAHCCRWIFPARVCIGAATAPKAAVRRSRKMSPPRYCCARAGRRLRARRRAARPHVRLRYLSHRGRLDRGGCRAGARARVLRVPGLARPRCAALGALARRGAYARRRARPARRCILGSDVDADAVRMAIANGEHAGVADWLHVEKRSLGEIARPKGDAGLIVANPPYGERIGAESGLPALYSELGRHAARSVPGLAGGDSHGQSAAGAQFRRSMPSARIAFFNGTIECRLLRFELNEASAQRPAEEVRADWSSRPGARMFANRLRKNLQRLDPWAEREHIDCFRVYDADMPEYAFAIDLYGREPAACLCSGICSAQVRQSGKCAGAPPRGVGGAARSAGGAAVAGAFAGAQAAEGQRAVREARRAGRTPRGAGRRPQILGQLPRLLGYRAVSRSPHRAGHACASGPRTRIS